MEYVDKGLGGTEGVGWVLASGALLSITTIVRQEKGRNSSSNSALVNKLAEINIS